MAESRPQHAPYLVISSDGHAGPPTEHYRPYLESRFHRDFDEHVAARDARRAATARPGSRGETLAAKWREDHEEGLRGGWDSAQRIKELDADGVAGEVVFPDAGSGPGAPAGADSPTAVPFGAGLGLPGDQDPERVLAGARAYNRWLAEFVSEHPERHRGAALLPLTAGTDAVVEEIRRAKESGLGALMIPAMRVEGIPYHDRRHEALWAAAAEARLPLVAHAGAAARHEYGEYLGLDADEAAWWPSRLLWFLLRSGVLERHPGLRFGFAEAGCWWLPNLLWSMDRQYFGAHGGRNAPSGRKHSRFAELRRPPHEYVDRQVFLCSTATKRRELAQRYEIGVDNILWGSGFPHHDGTWPHTRAWLRRSFHDLPIGETRRLLGLSAAEVFDFDRVALAPVAARIGPTPADLGQAANQSTVEAGWRRSRETGRHWLTGFDFPFLGVGQ
ncbi:amidohydrolase family protein [Streptomyces sp. NPDC060194]|uniref:amidohydrolase family protein n=1 Tax=Streptomyces sp. NPDC060194 TaxID=3347069 RepID=UPI00365D0004